MGALTEAGLGADAMVSLDLVKLRLADLVTTGRAGERQIYVDDDHHVIELLERDSTSPRDPGFSAPSTEPSAAMRTFGLPESARRPTGLACLTGATGT